MLIDEFIFGNTALLPTIWDYVHAQAKLQTVSNPSGTFLPQGLGLGEPKFQIDGTRFNGAWGRPQRDGPALRAIALMSFSNWLINNGQKSTAKTITWPIIANDLSKQDLIFHHILLKPVLTLDCRLRWTILEPNWLRSLGRDTWLQFLHHSEPAPVTRGRSTTCRQPWRDMHGM
jgi:hypothetical protein